MVEWGAAETIPGAARFLGTAKALYLENNTFTSSAANGFGITDTDVGGGARFVARFNTVTNGSFQTHGTESTGRDRGVRGMEVYSNSVTITSGAQGQIAGWRSGAGFLFNNTVTGPGQFNSGASWLTIEAITISRRGPDATGKGLTTITTE